MTARSRLRRYEVWLAAALVVADQATKAVIRATIPPHESIEIVPGLLNLTHVLNSGAAFGVLDGIDFPFKAVVVAGLALAALAAIAFYAMTFGSETRLSRLSLTLILAGAIGNLIDRVTAGEVVDFVDFHWNGWHFWAFNVADSAVTVGAILLILDMFRTGSHVPSTA
jgi:signal peptidase II